MTNDGKLFFLTNSSMRSAIRYFIFGTIIPNRSTFAIEFDHKHSVSKESTNDG